LTIPHALRRHAWRPPFNFFCQFLNEMLPPFVAARLREGLQRFGAQLRGFDTREAIVVGVETRSSRPPSRASIFAARAPGTRAAS